MVHKGTPGLAGGQGIARKLHQGLLLLPKSPNTACDVHCPRFGPGPGTPARVGRAHTKTQHCHNSFTRKESPRQVPLPYQILRVRHLGKNNSYTCEAILILSSGGWRLQPVSPQIKLHRRRLLQIMSHHCYRNVILPGCSRLAHVVSPSSYCDVTARAGSCEAPITDICPIFEFSHFLYICL